MTKSGKRSKRWTLRDAKAHFSELFESALRTPQRITRAPRSANRAAEVVVLSAETFDRMTRPDLPLADFLAGFAFEKFEPARDESFDRDVDFPP